MKDIILSKRMEAVVNMVSPQSFVVADVGCDHAYVSIALSRKSNVKKVIAMDVRKGPLDIAARNVALYGEQDSIDLRLSDGLEKLAPGEADTIIIAGMGGLLVRSILDKGKGVLFRGKESPVLILQPQSDLKEVRIFLYQNAYHIVQEEMLVEEGKYYTVMRAEPNPPDSGEAGCSEEWKGRPGDEVDISLLEEAEWVYGKYSLERKDEVLYAFLQKERKTLETILEKLSAAVRRARRHAQAVPEKTIERECQVKTRLDVNEAALRYYSAGKPIVPGGYGNEM